MINRRIEISGIPACVWGMASERVIVAIHGNMSSKVDVPIAHLAEHAARVGWQVLSFDLPQHGERKGQDTPCTMPQCAEDAERVLEFAKANWKKAGVFGVSMGAYVALATITRRPVSFAWLLSPTVEMGKLIDGMMERDGIAPNELQEKGRIQAQSGQIYWWDDYKFAALHAAKAECPAAILCGAKDEMTSLADMRAFAEKNGCELTVSELSGHWFHTNVDLAALDAWLKEKTNRIM